MSEAQPLVLHVRVLGMRATLAGTCHSLGACTYQMFLLSGICRLYSILKGP